MGLSLERLTVTEQQIPQDTPITPIEPGIVTDDQSMGDAYDRIMSMPDDEATPETAPNRDEQGRFKAKSDETQASIPPDQPGEAEAKAPGVSDRAPASTSLPANLPPDMADAWAAIPEAHRDRFGKVFTDLHQKMSDMGRQTAAYRDLKPVIDDMTATYADHFQNGMRPADAVNYLLTIQKDMDTDPVETILRIGTHYKVLPQIAAKLGIQQGEQQGGAYITQLEQTIKGLEQRITQAVSPDRINSEITRAMSEREVEQAVERFATEKPFYADVESYLPQFVAIAREQQPDANRLEWLASAYDMAVNAIPAVREKARAAAGQPAAAKPDPRAAAAQRASAINVTSTSSGRSKPKSESEAMGEVYDRLMKAS